jgi:hypothetical protein
MALQDAELRFPVRIRIGIPPEGLGNRLGQMNAWLDANWASNSDLAALRSVGVAQRYIISPWLPATAPRIGAFGMNSDFVDDDAEFAWMTRLSRETERPVWFLLTDRAKDPARWKRLMKHVHAARAQGAQITAATPLRIAPGWRYDPAP